MTMFYVNVVGGAELIEHEKAELVWHVRRADTRRKDHAIKLKDSRDQLINSHRN